MTWAKRPFTILIREVSLYIPYITNFKIAKNASEKGNDKKSVYSGRLRIGEWTRRFFWWPISSVLRHNFAKIFNQVIRHRYLRLLYIYSYKPTLWGGKIKIISPNFISAQRSDPPYTLHTYMYTYCSYFNMFVFYSRE